MERVLRLEGLRRRFEDEIESPRKRRRLIADTPPGENVAHAQASALLSSGLTTGVVAKKKRIRKKQPDYAAQKALRLAKERLKQSVRSLREKCNTLTHKYKKLCGETLEKTVRKGYPPQMQGYVKSRIEEVLELTNEKGKFLKIVVVLQHEVTNPSQLHLVEQRTQQCNRARAELTRAHANFNNSAGSVLKKIVAGI